MKKTTKEKVNPSLVNGCQVHPLREKVSLNVNVKATELPINKNGCKMQYLPLFTCHIFILLWQKHRLMHSHVPSKLGKQIIQQCVKYWRLNLIFSGSLTVICD